MNAKGIETHRLEDFVPVHSLESAIGVRTAIGVDMADVQPFRRRIRKFHQIIKLGATGRERQVGAVQAALLPSLAPFLLDRGRAAEVIDLLGGEQRADPLLLRLALAYRAQHRAEWVATVAALQARFDAARLRGDRVHLREEARFELELRDQPQRALPLAIQNWAVQKEPADALILLHSAAAAGTPEQAKTVVAFIRANHVTDQRLSPWLR